jgi:hypothetical protein
MLAAALTRLRGRLFRYGLQQAEKHPSRLFFCDVLQ